MTNIAVESWHTEQSIETTADPARIWALFRDVAGWKNWNAGVEQAALEGSFAQGTWFTMKIPEQDLLRSQLVEVRDGEGFVDETRVGDLVVRVAHRVARTATGITRVTYALDAVGPQAADIGPAIASDFPQVLSALAAAAEAGR